MVSYRELIGFFWRFMRRQKGTFFTIFLFDSLAWPADVLIWPYLLNFAIGIFTRFEGDRSGAWQALWPLIMGGISLVIFVETLSRAMGFLIGKAIPKMQADIRMEMFDHVQRHSPRYFNERFAGSLANKIVDMTTQAEQILQQLFWPVIPALISCLATVVILWFIHPIFAYIFGAWIAVHLTVILLFTRPIDVREHSHGEARSSLLGKIVDSLTNNFAVNLFYRFRYEQKALVPEQEVEEKTNVQAKWYAEKMSCFTSLFFFSAIF